MRGDGRGGSPASAGVPGYRAKTSQTGQGGHRQAVPRAPSPEALETCRRRRNRTRGAGAAHRAAARFLPAPAPGESSVGGSGGPATQETCAPALRWVPAPHLRTSGRDGGGRKRKKPRGLKRGRAGLKQAQPLTAAPTPPLCPSLAGCRSGARRPGAARPSSWCCLGCGPGARAGCRPGSSRRKPPLSASGAAVAGPFPRGAGAGTSSRGDREGARIGNPGRQRASAAPNNNSRSFLPVSLLSLL